ncbi:MAG TPA: cytochrome c oxidase accessory protein CcoG [Vicinamibacterales bacterium]|nr:cytochrome c oxidase accessory protein CcoG [Vicinamibacterales bacterium]
MGISSATVSGSPLRDIETRFATDHETFRNELASVARDGRRRWIYARQPKGRLYRARTILSVFLLAFLFLAPFITVGGQPLMLLDILHRHFVLLGMVFRPQDFYLVVLIALTVLVTLALSTVVVGRVWCGWLCPQTVFMEMLFRKLEYLIEGSAEQQLRRNRGPWTREKTVRKGIKHAIFFALSFAIANVFLAWIIGAQALWMIVTDAPARHLAGLIAITIFSFVFYMVFARFREQACILACPYGRVMSALIDTRTITVTYDTKRGEPRHRLTRTADAPRSQGDCIDCHQCVTVCPTGIDIRDGIQLECVNCTACIDACNDVMHRIGKAPGLIRLTSHHNVVHGAGRWLSARAASYAAVWLVLVCAVTFLLVSRRALDVLILRQPGTMYATVSAGEVANFYNIQAFNRTSHSTAFAISVVEPAGATLTALGAVDTVEPYGLLEGRLLVRVPTKALRGPSTPVRFEVRTDRGVVQTVDSAFLGPAQTAR